MKQFAIFGLALYAAASVSSAIATADALVANNKQTRTFDCAKDPMVLVAGDDNKITLRGACKLVRLAGNGNTVIADSIATLSADGNKNSVAVVATDAISANGNHNRVTWEKTIDGDPEPSISSWGDDNDIHKK